MIGQLNEIPLRWGSMNPCYQNWEQQSSTIFVSSATCDAISLSGAASWVLDVAKKLESLGRLRSNWDSYGGLPLKETAKSFTIKAIGYINQVDLPTPAVVLGSGGTIQLEWKADGKELDIDLGDGGGSIEFVIVDPKGKIAEGQEQDNIPFRMLNLASWLVD